MALTQEAINETMKPLGGKEGIIYDLRAELARAKDDAESTTRGWLDAIEAWAEERARHTSEIARLREALAVIAGFGDVNLAGEWESSLRDIIRSMTDCAKRALRECPPSPGERRRGGAAPDGTSGSQR